MKVPQLENHFGDYELTAGCLFWYGDKVCLSKVKKKCWHKGFWTDIGGKIDKGEDILTGLKREIWEEAGLLWPEYHYNLKLIDCYIYPEIGRKVFLYETKLQDYCFKFIKNKEPNKQGPWKLFTLEEALKLPLMPSIKFYLEKLYEKKK